MEIVFATGNKDKVKEISLMLDGIDLKTPADYGIEHFEVDEDGITLEANAYKKAKALYDIAKTPSLADDTGLFVEALENRPGVHAHRYAGENATYKDNRDKLLEELTDKINRRAYFETCICYLDEEGNDHYFTGRLPGTITYDEAGTYDFGYDQIFMADDMDVTLGELSQEEKNKISHRSKAVEAFKKYYKERYNEDSGN